jgi:hypothetical protein
MRIIHASLAYAKGELAKTDMAQFAADVDGQHYNAQHVEYGLSWDGDQKVFYFQTDLGKSVARDVLGDYLPEAHKRGIKVFIYMNVHWAAKLYIDENPDWTQRKVDGSPLTGMYGGSGASLCVNSPWRDWILALTEEMSKNYEIDGIFLDGPCFYVGTCYCESCKKRFRDQYGLDITAITDATSAHWREFIEFRYDSITRFVGDVRAAMQKYRPGAPLYMNANGLHSGHANGRHNRKLMAAQDILGAEGGFIFYGRPIDTPLWKVAGTAKFLEAQAGGKPTVIFTAVGHKPWEYPLTGPEIRLNVAATFAGGANPWLGGYYKDIHDPALLEVAEELAFFEQHAAALDGARGIGETALLWSHDTADYYGSHLPEIDFMVEKPQALKELDYQSSFSGGYEALMRSGSPFVLVDEFGIVDEGALKGIKTLLLTDAACLSDKAAAAIRAWVKAGGNLIATNNSSLFDESGRQRKDFALGDVLGASFVSPRGLSQWDAIYLEEELRRAYNLPREDIPSPSYQLRVKALPGAQVWARYYLPTDSRYSPKPDLSPDPAILYNRYGQGQCLYFAGNADRLYWTYRLPEYFELLTQAARRNPPLAIEAASSSVEVILRQRKDGAQIIHLLNYTGDMERPIKRILAQENVTLRLRTDRKPARVRALRLDKDLAWKQEGPYLLITLPALGLHEAIIVE